MSKRKTNEEFLNEMYEKHPEIKVRGLYRGAFEKVECECLNCGNVWDAVPKEMTGKKLRGCPRCGIAKRNESRRISNKEFLDKLEIAHNGNIVALENYVNAKTKIKFKCLKDGYIWKSEPYRVMNGTGCPMCTNHIKKTEDDFIQMLSERNPDVELVSKYKSMHERALFKCKVCNYEWETTPCHLVTKHHATRCPKCYGKIVPTTTEFIEKIYKINPNIEILDDYIDSKTKLKCRCLLCNGIFYMKPSHLISGHGCRHCTCSIGEDKIRHFLDEHNIQYESQKFFEDLKGIRGRVLTFDFYLPQFNLLIEFQGKQHEKPIKYFGGKDSFEIQQEHDRRKREYSKLHNINLLEIWYYDINKIEEIMTKALGLKLSA